MVDFAGGVTTGATALQSDSGNVLVAAVRTAPAGGDGRLSLVRRGGGAAFEVLFDVGGRAPLMPEGITISSYSGSIMKAAGQIAFSARLSGPGVTASNDVALYATMPSGEMVLVVREGGTISWATGSATVNVLATVAAAGGMTAATFNARGELVFGATMAVERSGIFVAAIPAPGSVGLMVVGVIVVARRRRA